MRSLWLLPTLLGAALAAVAQPRADATRTPRGERAAVLFAPDGATLRVAASGFHEVAADVLWFRAALVFGERYQADPDPAWTEVFARTVLAVTELDPTWRTPYFYGGSLLRVLGNIEASDEVFRRAVEHRPDDWYFAFSLGMNEYLYRDDPRAAAAWFERAAALPKAPAWYAAAAAAMRHAAGEREPAIRYLRDVLQRTESPAIRADTERQLGRLLHNQLVDGWEGACKAWRVANGRRLERPEDLARLGFTLPPNPRGDAWVVGLDGVVRSAESEADRLGKVRNAELARLRP